jgi:transposase
MRMLRPERSIERVYLHRAPIDMRKQMDGLAILAKEAMCLDPFSGSLFVFVNRRHNKLKILLWERNGFIVWYKRLEQDRFAWPKRQDEAILTLTGEQLNWLLDGYDVWRMKGHEPLTFSALS